MFVESCIAVGVPERGQITNPSGGTPTGPQSREYLWAINRLQATLPDGSRVLDVGSGESYGLREIVAHSFHGIGVDPDRTATRMAYSPDSSGDVIQAEAEHLPFADKTFEAAVMIESLEHTHLPECALSELKRVLRSGSPVIMTTPLADHRTAYHSRFHTVEWTVAEFRELLLSEGFAIEDIRAATLIAGAQPGHRRPFTVRLSRLINRYLLLPAPLPPNETILAVVRAPIIATLRGARTHSPETPESSEV